MTVEMKNKLEAAITACADKAAKADTSAIDAMQYTQAALNMSNALIGLVQEFRQKDPRNEDIVRRYSPQGKGIVVEA